MTELVAPARGPGSEPVAHNVRCVTPTVGTSSIAPRWNASPARPRMVPSGRVDEQHIGSNPERLDRSRQHRSLSQSEHPRLVGGAGFPRHHHVGDEPLPRHRHRPHQGSVTGSAGSCLPSEEGDEAATNRGLGPVEPRRRGQHAESPLLLEHRHRIGRPSTGVLARIGMPGGTTHRDDTTDQPSCGAMGLWHNTSRSRRFGPRRGGSVPIGRTGLTWDRRGLLLGVVYAIPAAVVVLTDVPRGLALSVGVVPAAVVGLPPRGVPAGSSPSSVCWSGCRSSSARSWLRSQPSPSPW